jgi:NDP-sugar pyrophosphorylase family protein
LRFALERIEGAILAAGRGDRLRAQGPDLPKPLVRLGGEPLLVRQTRILLEAGADRVVAVVNSETASVIERDAIQLPERLKLVVRDTPNSMETLFQLGDHLTGRWFLAATVDAVLACKEMQRFARQSIALTAGAHPIADGALGVVRWRGDERPLFVEVEADGAIRTVGATRSGLVTAGVYFLPGSIFIFRDRAHDAGLSALRQFLGGLVDWGVRLHAIELNDVIDIDVADDLEAAHRMLERERRDVSPGGRGGGM